MWMKSVLTILFLMLMACLRRSSAMSLAKGRICQKNENCAWFELCDKGRCRTVTTIQEVGKRLSKPCAGLFKKSCSSDPDCYCTKGSMICENNECVYRKNLNKSFTK